MCRKIPTGARNAGIQMTGQEVIAVNGSPGQLRWSGPGAEVATVPIALASIASPKTFQAIVTPRPEPVGKRSLTAIAGAVRPTSASKFLPSNVTWMGRNSLRMESPEGQLHAHPERLEGDRLPRRNLWQ